MSMNQVLSLNADWSPLRIVGWEHAIELILEGKVIVVESDSTRFVRSEKITMFWPTVIALKKYRSIKTRIKFSGKHVIIRDFGRCSYCGFAPRTPDGRIDRESLTHDHVVPRAQAKDGKVFLPWSKKWVNVTSWENATTACRSCNMRKADRTPMQAGMNLQSYPRVPTQADVLRMALSKVRKVPEAWAPYLPNALGLDVAPVVEKETVAL